MLHMKTCLPCFQFFSFGPACPLLFDCSSFQGVVLYISVLYLSGEDQGEGDKHGSPSKSDPMDSASGGETLEEHSSKEVRICS